MKRLAFLICLTVLALSIGSLTPTRADSLTADARATETQIASNIFATLTASAPAAATALSGTPTLAVSGSAPVAGTPTPIGTPDVTAEKQTYLALDARELQKAPDKYRGQKLVFAGEVFNIQETGGSTYMQIWIDYGGGIERIPIVINYPGPLPGLYKGDTVVAYGTGAGSSQGTNAFGGAISQPSILAQYVDYGAAVIPAPIEKNTAANLQGRWEVTYVGDFRDKTVFNYFGDLNKTAMGIWVTAQIRIKNLQPGTDYLAKNYHLAAVDQNARLYENDSRASSNAAWQYCGCDDDYDNVAPGQSTVIVATFDMPESTTILTVGFKSGLGRQPLPSPRFIIRNVDQIPAWKPKK